MNSYLQGMGYGVGMAPAPNTAAGAGGSVTLSGNVSGDSGQTGAMGLLVILGGLVVLYVATRSIQGSR